MIQKFTADTSPSLSSKHNGCLHFNVVINEMIYDSQLEVSAVFTALGSDTSHGSGPRRIFSSMQVLPQRSEVFLSTSYVMESYSNNSTASDTAGRVLSSLIIALNV